MNKVSFIALYKIYEGKILQFDKERILIDSGSSKASVPTQFIMDMEIIETEETDE